MITIMVKSPTVTQLMGLSLLSDSSWKPRKDLLTLSKNTIRSLVDKGLIEIESDPLRLGANKRLRITNAGLCALQQYIPPQNVVYIEDETTAETGISSNDLCWLAGLLEGEGCFVYDDSPGIRVGMTDLDVVQRVALLLGNRRVRGPYNRSTHGSLNKDVYYVECWSGPAIEIMKAILPYMGVRRSAKINEIIDRWTTAPTKGHKFGEGSLARCHPEKRHYANGLCRACWRKQRYKEGLSR
jgi:hypothetical protein